MRRSSEKAGEHEPLLYENGGSTGGSPGPLQQKAVPTMQQAQPISVTKKLGFAWGAPPNSLTHTLIGFQLNVFLLTIVKLQPRVVGAIVLSGRFWDGLMDPTVGMMTQRTRSRWGSLKPWLAGSIIPLALSYLAIWSVPPFYSESARAGFVAAAYLMYQLCISMYHVPYTSLTVHLSTLSRDVDSGTMYRVISETLAILVAAVLTKVIEPISEYFADYCGDNREGVCVYSGMGGLQLGYMAQAAIISALCVISGIGVLVTIGEQKVPPGGHAPPASFTEGFMTVIRTPSFRSLTMLFIWIWMGVAIIQANLLLYVQIVLGKPFSVATDLILVQLGVCVLSEPFWFLVMIEFGKKRTFILSLSLTIPVIFGLYFLDDGTPVWLLRLVFGIFGLSIAAVYLVPAAMTPDVINQAALREGGQRKEALFYSYSVLFQKFAAGIALFVSNELLESVGKYDSKSVSNVQAKPVLRLLMSVIPGTFGILSVLFALCYPLTTEKERQIKESLDRMVDGKMAESISAPQLTNVTRGAPVVDLVADEKPIKMASSVWDGVPASHPEPTDESHS